MEKFSLPKQTVNRYTLATLNGLYLVPSVLLTFLMILQGFDSIPFTVFCFCTLLGSSGCYILWRKDAKLMTIYRKTLLALVAVQILAFISTLLILLLRSYIAGMIFRHLMNSYHIDPSIKDVMDKVQLNFECCGLDSYKDWSNDLPLSCCAKTASFCNKLTAKLLGCKENLSMFMLLICLAFLFLSTGNIVFHAYCIHCAYELREEYLRAKNIL